MSKTLKFNQQEKQGVYGGYQGWVRAEAGRFRFIGRMDRLTLAGIFSKLSQ